jgi:hypothetical protein
VLDEKNNQRSLYFAEREYVSQICRLPNQRYRDWFVRAFNNDKPYDQFVRERIAGD